MKLLIVDDQVQTRDSLIRLCSRNMDLQVVGDVDCGKDAIDAAATLKPDIMLLDVELPDMSGFDLLRAVGKETQPAGIMLSQCTEHAAEAFAQGALDYLVMPVAPERFNQAMIRARQRVQGNSISPWGPNSPTLRSTETAQDSPRFLVGERLRRLYPLDPKSVDYIEADGNYVTLCANNVRYLSRDSIKRLAAELAPRGFIRIARSLLVNAASVEYAQLAGHGTYSLTLNCGACLHSSPSYRDSLLRIIPLPALSKRHADCTS